MLTKEAARALVLSVLDSEDPREAIKMVAEIQKELPPEPTDTERAISCLLSTSIAMIHDRMLADAGLPHEMRVSLSLLWLARLGNAIPLLAAIVRVGHAVMSELGNEDLGGIGEEAKRDMEMFSPEIAALERLRQMDRDVIDSRGDGGALPPAEPAEEEGPINGDFLRHLQEAEEQSGDGTPPTD